MIFVDTAYFLALLNPGDEFHKIATHWSEVLRGQLVTTDFVLVELLNACSKVAGRQSGYRIFERVRTDKSFDCVSGVRTLLDPAVELYKSRTDKEWSLTDCASFHVMRVRGIQTALTSDQHFEQAGFRALLREFPGGTSV